MRRRLALLFLAACSRADLEDVPVPEAGIDAARDADAARPDADADADADADLADASDADATIDDADVPDAMITCTTTETFEPPIASPHVDLCSEITYASRPPTSGPHYPVWAKYQVYDRPVPDPFLVHDLEHGGIVVRYRCDTPCEEELAALVAMLDARPVDPLCIRPLRNRYVVAPDPELDVRFAAAAWGAVMRSTCFDLRALGDFIDAHYAHGPENLCNDGRDIFDPRSEVPEGCGQ